MIVVKKNLYLFFTTLGLIFPYYFIFRFFAANDQDTITALFQLFSTNMSAAFTADLLVSLLVVWTFIYREAQRIDIKNWWVFVLLTLIGLSFALPLFLYFRERHLEQS